MLNVKLNPEQKVHYQRLCKSLNPQEKIKDNRYETFVFINEHPKYKDTYIVSEMDSKKGSRISQINSQFDANIRTDKYDLRGAKI